MIFAEEAGARFADTGPSVFETRDAVFVKRHRASGAVERAQNTIVPHSQRGEGNDGQGEQPGRRAQAEHDPGGQCECGDRSKAAVAERASRRARSAHFHSPRRSPVAIFMER